MKRCERSFVKVNALCGPALLLAAAAGLCALREPAAAATFLPLAWLTLLLLGVALAVRGWILNTRAGVLLMLAGVLAGILGGSGLTGWM